MSAPPDAAERHAMGKGRLEAFSDGVIAIIITIMVLELKAPHKPHLSALRPLVPEFFSYVLSFVYVGIYWNNHHHLLHAARQVSGPVLWANMHLLFWLSLVPFTTNWMGESGLDAAPVAMYGLVLLLSAVAFRVLVKLLIRQDGSDSTLARAVGRDLKGTVSILLYVVGMLAVLIHPLVGFATYVVVAAIWFVPDRRIARRLEHEGAAGASES